jgi:hypothetical protein
MTEECSICFSKEGEGISDELIKPCSCNSLKHRSCLNTWRSTQLNSTSFNNCEVCKFKYIIIDIPENLTDVIQRFGKLFLIIVFDLVKLFFTFLLISFFVGYLSEWLDIFEARKINFFNIPKILETGMITTMCYMSIFFILYLFIILNLGFPRIELNEKPNGHEIVIYILILVIISILLSIYYIFNYIILYRCKQRVLYSKTKIQIVKDLKI